MKQKGIKLLFLLSLLGPGQIIMAKDSQEDKDIEALNEQCNYSLVYLDENARNSIVELNNLLPNHPWSTAFKNLCQDIKDEGTVALYEQVDQVIDECLGACKKVSDDKVKTDLKNYKKMLQDGAAHISVLDKTTNGWDNYRSICAKTICKLNVCSLSVSSLYVNGIEYSDITVLGNTLVDNGFGGTLSTFANFYAQVGSYASIAAGTPVPFDFDGPTNGSGITRVGSSQTFNLAAVGTYLVSWQLNQTGTGQTVLVLNSTELAATVVGATVSGVQIVGSTIITTSVPNSILSVNSASGNFPAFTLTPPDGSRTHQYSATLTIIKIG